MLIKKGAISVHQVPSEISPVSQMELLRELERSAENGHPRFVLDCCKLKHIGTLEIRFLLCCLEEVMKHNGDIRLAMLCPEAQSALRHAGVDRVFEMYETTESAIHSYQLCPAPSQPFTAGEGNQVNEYAA